jgi:hypothetical protein
VTGLAFPPLPPLGGASAASTAAPVNWGDWGLLAIGIAVIVVLLEASPKLGGGLLALLVVAMLYEH